MAAASTRGEEQVAIANPHSTPTPDREARLLEQVRATLAGRYQIERRIGRGAMAVVYRARRVDGDRPSAIKVMRPEIGYQDGVVERFRIESEVMAQLDHPHIVRLHDRGAAGEILWFEMDLVEGTSLDAVLQSGPLAWHRAVRFLAGAADALAYAHAQGVIHRDIKPANLLVPAAHDQVMVTDFGIARIVGTDHLTATGMAVGTPAYMSPEQFIAGLEVTPATDQYSLGVVAYEMITGTVPDFPAEYGTTTSTRRRRSAVHARAPACPNALAVLVSRMMAPDINDRWPDLGVVSGLAREIAETGTAKALEDPGLANRISAVFRRLFG